MKASDPVPLICGGWRSVLIGSKKKPCILKCN